MSPTFAKRVFAVVVVLLAAFCGSCDTGGFTKVRGGKRLAVELVAPSVLGTRLEPLALTIDQPIPFRVVVRALRQDGTVDGNFNGFVRLSAKPGSLQPIAGPDAQGRNVLLRNGESAPVDVALVNAFGTSYILADDLGYLPTDPLRSPPPQCANGVDDDGDGRVDFPSDEGCAFANDDNEAGGSYAQGASNPIFFRLPRIADIRGLNCSVPGLPCSGNGVTPYQKEPIQIDTGFRERPDGTTGFDFDVVVTRIASDGFYVTDRSDTRGGFNSVFAFNFNPPPRMRVCDRIKSYGGTANEFFGFTQMSYPTWTLEEWDPQKRPCLVPEPDVLTPGEIQDKTNLLPISGSLVRVETRPDGLTSARITPKFGANPMPKVGDVYVPGADATNCDFNGDGRIDFAPGSAEGACASACEVDAECTEFSNFKARSTFRITVTDANQSVAAIQADGTTATGFDPLLLKGAPLRAFTGTLHYFSGGSQFTIEARCKDDIVLDVAQTPLPSDKACVFPRTVLDNNPQ